MTPETVKLIVFITLLVHGIGHLQGVAAGLGLKINKSVPAQSWLLKGLSNKANKTICMILFLITAAMGILTALGFRGILLSDAWQSLAIATAAFSTLCLIIYPNALAMFFNKAGAIAVNLIIYYSLVFGQNWPTVIFND